MNEEMNFIIRRAGKLLENYPTTEEEARDGSGQPVDSCDPEACSWCLIGALQRSYKHICPEFEWYEMVEEVRKTLGYKSLIDLWEGDGTSDETRLEIARKLQNYGK